MPREQGDLVKAMYEENFLSSWLREDTESKAEEVEESTKRTQEDLKIGKREVGREMWIVIPLALHPFLLGVDMFPRRGLWKCVRSASDF